MLEGSNRAYLASRPEVVVESLWYANLKLDYPRAVLAKVDQDLPLQSTWARTTSSNLHPTSSMPVIWLEAGSIESSEHFDQIKNYVFFTEAQTYGRYAEGPSDDYYPHYNMQNNTSLMIDNSNSDMHIRRSLRDLPRQLNDYQRSKETVTNRGEKTESSVYNVDN